MNLSLGKLDEEDTMHQLVEDMEIGKQDYVPSNVGMDEVVYRHVF